MEGNLNRMLEKLDFIFELARNCNSTLKRIKSQNESRHVNSVPSEVRDSNVVENVYDASILLLSLRIH